MNDRYPIPEFLRRPVEAPRERPILFSAPMIRALLAGTKTQTRRAFNDKVKWHFIEGHGDLSICPYGQPGDRLYVRETAWQRPERTQKMMREGADTWPPFIYDADYGPDGIPESEREDLKRWGWKRRQSIHLPRLGSRILLEITAIRIERLNDISEADAEAEGIQRAPVGKLITFTVPGADVEKLGARAAYKALWNSINGAGAWDDNPYVWCLTFRRVKP